MRKSRSSMQVWDILSIAVLVLTACLVGYFVLIFFDPNSSLNVLPPTGRSVSAFCARSTLGTSAHCGKPPRNKYSWKWATSGRASSLTRANCGDVHSKSFTSDSTSGSSGTVNFLICRYSKNDSVASLIVCQRPTPDSWPSSTSGVAEPVTAMRRRFSKST